MGNPSFTIGPGEVVQVAVPWDVTQGETTVVLKFRPLTGKGRDRQRLEAFLDNHRVRIERKKQTDQEAGGDD